jgi:hypothetical protein
MDEALDVAELAVESGLEGVFTWLLRLLGILAIVAGIGLWLFTEVGLLIPAALVVVGVVLVAAPSVLLFLVELT